MWRGRGEIANAKAALYLSLRLSAHCDSRQQSSAMSTVDNESKSDVFLTEYAFSQRKKFLAFPTYVTFLKLFRKHSNPSFWNILAP